MSNRKENGKKQKYSDTPSLVPRSTSPTQESIDNQVREDEKLDREKEKNKNGKRPNIRKTKETTPKSINKGNKKKSKTKEEIEIEKKKLKDVKKQKELDELNLKIRKMKSELEKKKKKYKMNENKSKEQQEEEKIMDEFIKRLKDMRTQQLAYGYHIYYSFCNFTDADWERRKKRRKNRGKDIGGPKFSERQKKELTVIQGFYNRIIRKDPGALLKIIPPDNNTFYWNGAECCAYCGIPPRMFRGQNGCICYGCRAVKYCCSQHRGLDWRGNAKNGKGKHQKICFGIFGTLNPKRFKKISGVHLDGKLLNIDPMFLKELIPGKTYRAMIPGFIVYRSDNNFEKKVLSKEQLKGNIQKFFYTENQMQEISAINIQFLQIQKKLKGGMLLIITPNGTTFFFRKNGKFCAGCGKKIKEKQEKICTGCESVYYCSKDCQYFDWTGKKKKGDRKKTSNKNHKEICDMMNKYHEQVQAKVKIDEKLKDEKKKKGDERVKIGDKKVEDIQPKPRDIPDLVPIVSDEEKRRIEFEEKRKRDMEYRLFASHVKRLKKVGKEIEKGRKRKRGDH